jgi:hypothetical protein
MLYRPLYYKPRVPMRYKSHCRGQKRAKVLDGSRSQMRVSLFSGWLVRVLVSDSEVQGSGWIHIKKALYTCIVWPRSLQFQFDFILYWSLGISQSIFITS